MRVIPYRISSRGLGVPVSTISISTFGYYNLDEEDKILYRKIPIIPSQRKYPLQVRTYSKFI